MKLLFAKEKNGIDNKSKIRSLFLTVGSVAVASSLIFTHDISAQPTEGKQEDTSQKRAMLIRQKSLGQIKNIKLNQEAREKAFIKTEEMKKERRKAAEKEAEAESRNDPLSKIVDLHSSRSTNSSQDKAVQSETTDDEWNDDDTQSIRNRPSSTKSAKPKNTGKNLTPRRLSQHISADSSMADNKENHLSASYNSDSGTYSLKSSGRKASAISGTRSLPATPRNNITPRRASVQPTTPDTGSLLRQGMLSRRSSIDPFAQSDSESDDESDDEIVGYKKLTREEKLAQRLGTPKNQAKSSGVSDTREFLTRSLKFPSKPATDIDTTTENTSPIFTYDIEEPDSDINDKDDITEVQDIVDSIGDTDKYTNLDTIMELASIGSRSKASSAADCYNSSIASESLGAMVIRKRRSSEQIDTVEDSKADGKPALDNGGDIPKVDTARILLLENIRRHEALENQVIDTDDEWGDDELPVAVIEQQETKTDRQIEIDNENKENSSLISDTAKMPSAPSIKDENTKDQPKTEPSFGSIADNLEQISSNEQQSNANMNTANSEKAGRKYDTRGGVDSVLSDLVSKINERIIAKSAAVAAGDDLENKKDSNIWMRALYGSSTQSSTTGNIGYRGNMAGASVGAEFETDGGTVLGAAYSNLKGKYIYKDSDRADIRFNIFSIYAETEINNFVLLGMASYGHNKVKTRDYINDAHPTEFGSFTSKSYGFDAMVGYKIKKNNIDFTPFVEARYSGSKDSAYTAVKDDGSAGTSYDKASLSALLVRLGIRASKPIAHSSGFMITPYVNLSVERDVNSQRSKVSAYDVDGSRINLSLSERGKEFQRAKFGYNIEGGLGVRRSNIEMSVSYKGHFRKNYHSHQGSLKLKLFL